MFQTMYTFREIIIETLDTSFSVSNIHYAKIYKINAYGTLSVVSQLLWNTATVKCLMFKA
jgi:hypothetical protein